MKNKIKSKIKNVLNEFVSKEHRSFDFKIGNYLASSLSGFVTGVIVSSIVWYSCISFFS